MQRRPFFDSSWRAFVALCVVTVGMTWPLAWHISTNPPLGVGDLWASVWTFWWWKKALVDLHQSPYFTSFLFFPFGAKIVFHGHSEINMIAMLPITVWLGPVAAHNTATLAAVALSGLGAYLLARELTGDARAALLAGLIFAFCPNHLEQALEHLNLATVQFLPLVALYLVRLVRYGGVRNALLLGIFFALNALGAWHYALFAVLLLPVLLAGELAVASGRSTVRWRRGLAGLSLAAVTALLIMGPFLWPLLRGVASGEAYVKRFANVGIDIAFLLLPSDHHPILGWLTEPYYRTHRAYTRVGFLAYLGLTPVILAALGVRAARGDRRLVAWAIVGAAFLVLALGARPRVGGTPLAVRFPHGWFASLPILQTLRIANRFLAVTMLAVAVLAAAGAARLMEADRRRWLFPLAAALILFEYLWIPFPTQRVAFPSYLRTLAGDPTAGAVLDIPFCDSGKCAVNQAFQTVHGSPLAGGYMSVRSVEGVGATRRDPVLGVLMGLKVDVPETIDVAYLRTLGFGTVIVHKDRTIESFVQHRAALGEHASFYQRRLFHMYRAMMPQATLDGISKRFEAVVGAPVYEDEQIRVFRLR